MNSKSTKIIFIGLVIIAVLAAGVFLFKRFQGAMPSQGILVAEVKSKGPVDAPIKIVEYSDFQCPACQFAQPILEEIFADYPDQVYLVFRHFPLQGHVRALPAHVAAQCAANVGKFWEYHDRLYADQKNWSTTEDANISFLQYAREANMDLDVFAECYSNEDVVDFIQKEKTEGVNLKVRSTPTFFINEERIVGGRELREKGIPLIQKMLGVKVEE